MKKIVTFGEVMMRLSTPGFQRFVQTRSLDMSFAGGEANVAASLSQFGMHAVFITRLPENDLGDACENYMRQFGIDTSCILRGGERLGVYFLESGAAQRGSKVIYDRADSAIATMQPGSVNWSEIFSGADWFHWTGITPAISKEAAACCLEAIEAARTAGVTVSCDLNYRAKLWKWGKKASEVMPELVSKCDLAIGNEEDAAQVFGIHAEDVDVTSGKVDAGAYRAVCDTLMSRFPNLKQVAITLRGSLSASHNTWGAILRDGDDEYVSPMYDITPIVDRVGGGDSFVGGLIYGLNTYAEPQKALDFAVAASCLKHSIHGDFNLVTVSEVEKLMGGDASGRVSR